VADLTKASLEQTHLKRSGAICNQQSRLSGCNWVARLALVMLVPLVGSGCGPTPAASFRLNLFEASSQQLKPSQEQQVATILAALFGTPDDPVVLPETGLDKAKLLLAAGPVRSDIVGRKNGLYREHCAHCHGVTGDGMGPTAAFLNPYPRDYRPGVFKFKSTERADKPTHDDLVLVLRNGLAGSSMPSFDLLSDAKIDALVEYVKYLSIRGQVELALMRAYFELDDEDQGRLPETREFLVEEILIPVAESWQSASDAVIDVPEMPDGLDMAASIAKGKELFYGNKANCVKCHGVTGIGDGQANDYDDWNKVVVQAKQTVSGGVEQAAKASTWEMDADELAEHEADLVWLERFGKVLDGNALRPRTIRPRNLRQGVYRGGMRPLDIYYRIHAGINGAPMPAAKGTVAPEDIWHIVNYVRSLPYDLNGTLGVDRPMVARDRL
jgi:mono/diheme cytochrome c family protein